MFFEGVVPIMVHPFCFNVNQNCDILSLSNHDQALGQILKYASCQTPLLQLVSGSPT